MVLLLLLFLLFNQPSRAAPRFGLGLAAQLLSQRGQLPAQGNVILAVTRLGVEFGVAVGEAIEFGESGPGGVGLGGFPQGGPRLGDLELEVTIVGILPQPRLERDHGLSGLG